jgi:hypothetical protein
MSGRGPWRPVVPPPPRNDRTYQQPPPIQEDVRERYDPGRGDVVPKRYRKRRRPRALAAVGLEGGGRLPSMDVRGGDREPAAAA